MTPADGATEGKDPVAEPATSAADGSPEALAERIAELEALLATAQADAGKARDEWLRARAETDNVRRRSQDELAKAHRFAVEGFAGALLTVKDSLEAALTVENTSIDSFKQGVELTARQLDAAFERFALKEVAPKAGEKFDPHFHQAISQVESDQEPNTVVTLLQKGWLIHERVLRPALVTVAKPRDAAPGADDEQTD